MPDLETEMLTGLSVSRAGITQRTLESLFGCKVVVAQAVPELVADELLYADERAYVAGAVAKRRAEFGTARVCARQALAQLGFEACSLAPSADRSPRWPPGVVGTISHTEGYCVVAVASSAHVVGLGLDVEQDSPLPRELEAMICTEGERSWLEQWSGAQRGAIAKLIFSAKEAFYKCQHPTTHEFLDFREVELELDLRAETFSVARIQREGAAWQLVLTARGRLFRSAGLILTAATLLGRPPRPNDDAPGAATRP